jgi:hypothetical protein
MKQGKKTPDGVVNFIIRTMRNAPRLTQSNIVDKIFAEYGLKIDKSTVGRILSKSVISMSTSESIGDPERIFKATKLLKATQIAILEKAKKLILGINLPEVLSYSNFWPDQKQSLILHQRNGEVDVYQEALRTNLANSGFSEVIQDIEKWNEELEQLFERCSDFCKIAVSKIKVPRQFPDKKVENNEKPGYQRDFFASACADAIEIANGRLQLNDSGYWTIKKKNAYGYWNLYRVGSGSIYVAKTELGAKRCRYKHQALTMNLLKAPQAKEIMKLHLDLKQQAKQIKSRLLFIE